MNIDFRRDAADLQAFIVDTLTNYAAVPASERGRHDPITRIGLWFWLGDGGDNSPYVAIQLDTRPDAEPDGEWTFEHFAMLERPHWRAPIESLIDGADDVTVTFKDDSTRKLRSAETDQVFGDFCVDVLKSTAAAGLLRGPHVAPGCEMDVECDDFHFGWPDYEDRGLENMADPAENGRRRAPTPPADVEQRFRDDARLYDVFLLVPPDADRRRAIAGVATALGIGVAAARDLIDASSSSSSSSGGSSSGGGDRVLAELVDAREVRRLGKLLRGAGLDVRVDPPFRWPIE